MTFSIIWNESYPAGTDLGSGIDTYIQQDKIATRERAESLYGISDFATRYPMSADAFAMNGIANSYIMGGTATWGVTDSTGVTPIFGLNTVTNAAAFAGALNIVGVTTTAQLDVNAAQARCVEYDAGNFTGAKTVDFNNGNNQKFTLTGSSTLTLSNPLAGTWYQFRIIQGGAGSYTVTWPATVKWQGGIAPTLTTSVGYTDVIALFYNGTNYLALVVGLNWNG